jgi:hypothetical protein
MEPHLQPENEHIRISHSLRRSPHVTHGLKSPVRSEHAMQMESLNSQADMGMRTTDFFDDSSEDERTHAVDPASVAPDVELAERRGSATRRRRTASTSEPFGTQCESRTERLEPDQQGYQRLLPEAGDTANSSFHGSVDELLPRAHQHSSPPQFRSSRLGSERTPRSSAQIDRSVDQRHASMPVGRADRTIGAYAIAHEITLNALMRDGEALDRSLQSFALAPLQTADRQSAVPQALDPRSPRNRNFPSPGNPSSASGKKSVQVVPPPIDTTAPRRSIPDDIVRTPYPFSPPEEARHKDFRQLGSPPGSAAPSGYSSESTLTVSIRRRNANSKVRITSLTIPASNDFTAIRSNSVRAKERHFKALDFDDMEFFKQLRRCYKELSGPLRFISARSLVRIAVSGPASKAADVRYGWRSPILLAYKGLSDTFSEEQILRHYRRPELGHSRYAFVHWAHRLASITPPRTAPEIGTKEGESRDLFSSKEHPEGLEFIMAWSVLRISVILMLVIVSSAASALLWMFLGRNTPSNWPPDAGFRDAGDRVGSGLLLGICVLLLGLTSMAGWVGASWLLM